MIELKKISKFELPELIMAAYKGDESLLNQYHVEIFTLEQAVESTLWMIETTEENEGKNMEHYSVSCDGEPIGYVSIFPNMLYSWGLNKEYRSEDIKQDFWESICDILEGKFIVMLYPNNTRAINFCKRQGMIEVENIEQNCVTLLNTK